MYMRHKQEPVSRNRRYSSDSTSTYGRGPRTVDDHNLPWTKDDRCCRAMTQRPWTWQKASKSFWKWQNKRSVWIRQRPQFFGQKWRMKNNSCAAVVFSSCEDGRDHDFLLSEWCFHDVMMVLRYSSTSPFVTVNECRYKDILEDIVNLTCEELSEEWYAHISAKSGSPALWKNGNWPQRSDVLSNTDRIWILSGAWKTWSVCDVGRLNRCAKQMKTQKWCSRLHQEYHEEDRPWSRVRVNVPCDVTTLEFDVFDLENKIRVWVEILSIQRVCDFVRVGKLYLLCDLVCSSWHGLRQCDNHTQVVSSSSSSSTDPLLTNWLTD